MYNTPISEVKRILSEPNGSEKLMEHAVAALPAAWELFRAGFAPSGAFLFRCARRQAMCDFMNEQLGDDRVAIKNALSSSEPKMRKNGAKLSGALGDVRDVPAIINALNTETTRMVIPSYLLALGALGGDNAKAVLSSYEVKPVSAPNEAKHEAEERAALASALMKFTVLDKHEFIGLKAARELELRTADHMADALYDELFSLSIDSAVVSQNAVRVNTADILELYKARCFSEILFPIGRGVTLSPKAIAHTSRDYIKTLMNECHSGSDHFGYRVEIRGGKIDRATFTKECAQFISDDSLINSTNDYEVELRIEITPHGTANIYAKLFTITDNRFDYRKAALPASIAPSTAAAVLRFALPYIKEGARVLDPCCGSGTMLIERGKLTECASLTGVDIAHKAIDIARENSAFASCNAKYVINDCLRFEAIRKYNELISNLPFGNRVGTHKDNEALYAGLLNKIPDWVERGGIAILYTMEFTLLKKLLRVSKGLSLISETKTSAGGLMPGIFIIKVK